MLGGAVETCSRGRKRLVLVALCSGLFMAMVDNLVVSTALPAIGRELRAGTSGLQWVVEAYSLVYASLLLTGGVLGDRWGRRPVYLAGLALFTTGSALCASAGSLAVLVTGRAVQGVGAALLTPGSLAILRHVFTGESERARAIGVWSGVSGAGLAVGPALGGPLVDRFGWASAFWINVPLGVGSLLLAARILPPVPRSGARPDPAGQITAVAGLGTLVYALVEGPVRGWGDRLVLGAALAAVLLLAGFVTLELLVPSPMVDLRLFAHRGTGAAVLAGFTVSFGFFGLGVFLSLYLQSVLGYSATAAGLVMLPATLCTGGTAIVAGRLCARHGPRLPLAAGLALVAASVAGFTRCGCDTGFGKFWWLMPLLGVGLGLTFTPISIAVMNAVEPARAGMASATVNMFREIGGVAGVAVMGAVSATRCASDLRARVPGAGVLAHSVVSGGGHGLGRGLPAAARGAVDGAFVDGLHLAMVVGATALAVMAALVLLLMRRSDRANSGAVG
ncbi:MFS transporter [Streptantibioticus rubrisoli]|uniref:MFS transporter n=1 Tax=Streptantibioticus rubrisoli TaxID=1387313 RepID=A0ABT1P630_9ACTN|nr:MFS transporter [Streptantibioticus rubrisoli]MCQ4040827.1 MFS transporter [Streptantibioticus rubrisoli]